MPDADRHLPGIEQRFDVLSGLIERRQGDAIEQGNMLFRDLERRLDEVADRLDQRQAAARSTATGIMDAIDARFSALAQTLESGSTTAPATRRSAAWKPGSKAFPSGSTRRRRSSPASIPA